MNKSFKSFGQWELLKRLGSGAFGEVFLWKHRVTGREIAIKSLKANPKLKPDEINILHKRWLKEYQWMQNLHTDYIVGAAQINDINFVNYLMEHNSTNLSLPVIIMDYCNGGDLRHHLNNIVNINGLIEFEVRNILYALLRATEYLHQECNIEHRDIKPENIVLHITEHKKIYKLTDFGYAREIPENTIAQSVVGTRNYVAPEVIDPGIYTKTVDYWSIGVLAYEIICGIQPFIPHQTFVNRMKNIQLKPTRSIAIVQNIDDSTFRFVNDIEPLNHLSCSFKNGMKKWLRLALDTNYSTRGFDCNNQLKFYTELDDLLEKKICTVFSLKTLKKYYYDIELFENLQSFHKKLCDDNGINLEEIFLILPPLHPKKFAQKPMDYFVAEWCDTKNTDNPPVMLFVTEFLIKSHCDIDLETYFRSTEIIEKCMSIRTDNKNIPLWLLERFEKDVHFILSELQHILECYLMGLQNFAIEIEHETFKDKDGIDLFIQETSQLSGSIKHANIVLDEVMNVKKKENTETFKMITQQYQQLAKSYIPQLIILHRDVLQNSQNLAKNKIYEKLAKEDLFELSKYRKHLSSKYTTAERLENAQIALEKCDSAFKKFTQNSELIKIRISMHEQLEKLNCVRQKVSELKQLMCGLEKQLETFTRSLLRNIISDKLSLSMSSLHIDGTEPNILVLMNHCSLNDFDMDSKTLISECETLCNAMETSLD